jgi:tetraacyldisaccharide-1-P 4'-kinase
VVLIDAAHARLQEPLFPAGRLREPWHALRRADQVWLTHADRAGRDRCEQLAAWARRWAPHATVATARHRLTALQVPGGEKRDLRELAGTRVLAVSGLGQPRVFEDSLREAGAEVVPVRFPDHHAYTVGEAEALRARARTEHTDLMVTTAKDAVKLEQFCREAPVALARLDFLSGERGVQAALEPLAARVRPRPEAGASA